MAHYFFRTIFLNQSSFVISLGGGTPCYFDNIDYINLKDETTSVFLKSSPKELANRLYDKKNNRPLISHIQSKEQLEEYIAKHLFERLPYYEKAKKTIITDNKSIKSLVEEINLFLT